MDFFYTSFSGVSELPSATKNTKRPKYNGRCSTRLLGFDPDSLHVATACSFPPKGRQKNKTGKRRTSAPARKKKYVRFFFFLVRFWAFPAKGSSKTRFLLLVRSRKFHPREILFRGGIFFPGGFFSFFSFDFFVALVKRLSVRGTQKRNKKCFAGSCV
jgi:hypothetical protein